jgi:addiction module RelE/StbE family toxin
VRVVWRATAVVDIEAIHRHIHEENPRAAQRIAAELYLTGERLDLFPYRGRPGHVPGTRELVVMRPYVLIYRIDAATQTVHILRIWHGARDR